MSAYTKKRIQEAERLRLNKLIADQLLDWDSKHADEIDALILWELHQQLGFGPTRLKRFFDAFSKEYENLKARYECQDEGGIWICTQKLKEIGVDVTKWREENQFRKDSQKKK